MDTDTGKRMIEAAAAFLGALQADQKNRAMLDFADAEERKNWHYVPRERTGLPLKEMDGKQRESALALVAAGLSITGYRKATTIARLEEVLAEIEEPGRRFVRDPELYYVSIFGDPGGDAPWGWRFEGHHISLNYVLVENRLTGQAPHFFGANPACVLHGDRQGLRVLAEEEDMARQLLFALDGEQKRVAVIGEQAPPDILTANLPDARGALEISGLAAVEMDAGQRELLRALVAVYVGRLPEVVAAAETEKLEGADWNRTCFAWMGAEERGGPHYYRVQGSTFLAEYDNTQNDANHIHAVWRDLENDFGEDALRRHYHQDHR